MTTTKKDKLHESQAKQIQTIAHYQATDTQTVPEQLSPSLCAEHDATWYRASLWSVEVSFPSWVPSQLLVHSQFTCWGMGWGAAVLSNNKNIPALSALFPAQIQNISCHEENWLYSSQNQTELVEVCFQYYLLFSYKTITHWCVTDWNFEKMDRKFKIHWDYSAVVTTFMYKSWFLLTNHLIGWTMHLSYYSVEGVMQLITMGWIWTTWSRVQFTDTFSIKKKALECLPGLLLGSIVWRKKNACKGGTQVSCIKILGKLDWWKQTWTLERTDGLVGSNWESLLGQPHTD